MLETDLPHLWSNIAKPTSPLPLYDLCDGGCLKWALLYMSMSLALSSKKLWRSFQKLKRNSQWQKPKSGWQSKSALSSCSLTQTTPGDRDGAAAAALCARGTPSSHLVLVLGSHNHGLCPTPPLPQNPQDQLEGSTPGKMPLAAESKQQPLHWPFCHRHNISAAHNQMWP